MPKIDFSEEENVEWDRRSGLKWFVHGEHEDTEDVDDSYDTNYFPENNRKLMIILISLSDSFSRASSYHTPSKRPNNDKSKPRQMLILKKSD